MTSSTRAALQLVKSAVIARMLRALRAAILARLLAPHVFGSVALIGAVVSPILSLTNVGLANSIAREAHADERLVASANWASRVLAALTVSLLSCVVYVWTHATNRRELFGPALISALAIGVYLMPQAGLGLLQQQRQFRVLARIEIAFDLVWTGMAVLLAAVLRSVWALVLAELAAQVARGALIRHAVGRSIGANRYQEELNRLVHFAIGTLASGTLYGLVFAGPILLLQRHCTEGQIGLYALAATYSQVAAFVVAGAASRVLLPELSKTKAEERMALVGRYSERITALLAILTGLIASAGPPFLVTLVGDNWSGAKTPLALLTWAVGIRVSFPFSLLSAAAGRPILESIVAGFSLICLGVLEFTGGWTSIDRGAAFVLVTDLASTGFAIVLATRLWGKLGSQYIRVAAIWALALFAAGVARASPVSQRLWLEGIGRASVFLVVFGVATLGSKRLRTLYKDELRKALSAMKRGGA